MFVSERTVRTMAFAWLASTAAVVESVVKTQSTNQVNLWDIRFLSS